MTRDLEAENAKLRQALNWAQAELLRKEGLSRFDMSCVIADVLEDLASTPKAEAAREEPAKEKFYVIAPPGCVLEAAKEKSERLKRFGDLDRLDDLVNGRITLAQYQGEPTPKAEAARKECPRCAELERAIHAAVEAIDQTEASYEDAYRTIFKSYQDVWGTLRTLSNGGGK